MKKLHTTAEAKEIVKKQTRKYRSLLEMLGGHHADVKKQLKALISTSNSVSLQFLKANRLEDAKFFLEQAKSTDRWFEQFGSLIDKSWSGRLLTLIELGYLYHQEKKHSQGLKSMEYFKQLADPYTDPEVLLAGFFVTFLILSKLQKFEEAKNFLNTCQALIKNSEKLSHQNLAGVISMASASLKIHSNRAEALQILRNFLKNSDVEELLVRPVVSEYLGRLQIGKDDWMFSKNINNLIFNSLFVQFIDPELLQVDPEELKLMELPKRRNSVQIKSKKPKHWWEKPQFFENIFKGFVNVNDLNPRESSNNNTSRLRTPTRKLRDRMKQRRKSSADFYRPMIIEMDNQLMKPLNIRPPKRSELSLLRKMSGNI